MNNNRAIINRQTGEVLEEDYPQEVDIAGESDPTMAALTAGRLPLHLQKLFDKNLDEDEAEFQLSVFTGVEPVDFAPYINKTVDVLGVIAWKHGPFIRASDDRNGNGRRGEVAPGYWKILIAIDEKDSNGNNIVLGTSGVNIFPHMAHAMTMRGWYLWEKPVPYLITKGGKSGAYFMRNMSRKNTTVKQVNHKA